jgi:hypothetical protein
MRSLQARMAGCVAGCAWLVSASGPLAAEPPPAAANSRTATSAAAAPASAVVSALSPLRRSEAEWRALLATIPELAALAAGFVPFGPAATDDALTRGGRSRASVSTWSFGDGPVEWRPSAGQRFWIVVGASGPRALIAVLSADPAAPRHLASTVIAEAGAPIALGVSPGQPREVLWTTCYGCAGQGGTIQLGGSGRPSFVYR